MNSMQLNSLKSILPHPNPLSLQFNKNKIYIFSLSCKIEKRKQGEFESSEINNLCLNKCLY